MLCDGRVVCGCADPYGKRVLGDARTTPVGAIWTGETASTLRRDLNAGGSTFCGDCPLKLPLADDEPARIRPLHVGAGGVTPLPRRLYVETTAACNISCLDACCAPETGITKTRQAGMLDPALFERVLDELGPTLARLDFFNYGEAFLHKKAVEMCELVKARYPHIYLYTSTNGGAFTEDARPAARAVGHRRDDVLARRRLAGRLRALPPARQLREVDGDDARRHRREAPPRARRAGHQLALHPVQLERQRPRDGSGRGASPPSGASTACAGRSPITPSTPTRAGSRPAPRSTPRSATRSGTTTTSATRSPARCRGRGSRSAARRRTRRCTSTPGATVRIADARPQPVAAAFAATATYGRRHVRLGAQLATADGAIVDRDWARAFLPHAGRRRRQGRRRHRRADAAASPGRYALRFDLVSEGIDWFETCGSEPTVRELVVGASRFPLTPVSPRASAVHPRRHAAARAAPSGIAAEVDAVYAQADALYRDLHRQPELSGHEEKTAATLAAGLARSATR